MEKTIKMFHFDNGLQLVAESGSTLSDNVVRNPFQIITRPGEDGRMTLSVMAYGPYGVIGTPIAINENLVIMSYVVDDKGIIKNYNNAVADLKQKRSGIIVPKASSLDLV
jgi:hypothetical protein